MQNNREKVTNKQMIGALIFVLVSNYCLPTLSYLTDGDQTSVTPLTLGTTSINLTKYSKSGNFEKLMCFNFHENENASYVSGKLAAYLYGGRLALLDLFFTFLSMVKLEHGDPTKIKTRKIIFNVEGIVRLNVPHSFSSGDSNEYSFDPNRMWTPLGRNATLNDTGTITDPEKLSQLNTLLGAFATKVLELIGM